MELTGEFLVEGTHVEREDWDELIQSYLTRAELTQRTSERVLLLRKVAKIEEEQLNNRQAALDVLLVAWAEDYTNEATALELERVAAKADKWQELLSAASEVLEDDPTLGAEARAAIYFRCATWYRDRLGRSDEALPFYTKLFELQPSRVDVLHCLIDTNRTLERWDDLLPLLQRLLDRSRDCADKVEILLELAQIWTREKQRPERAIDCYQKVLALDASSQEALAGLERTLRGKGDWDKLLELLRQRVEAAHDLKSACDARLKLGETLFQCLDDTPRAISLYERVLADDPRHMAALRGILPVYAAAGRWQCIPPILESQLQLVTGDHDRIDILLRLARTWEDSLFKLDQAVNCLERVLELDPEYVPALVELSRLYEQTGEFESLVVTLERQIDACLDKKKRAAAFRQMGRVWAEKLGVPDLAIKAYRDALQLNSEDMEALDALLRLKLDSGDRLTMIEFLTAQVDAVPRAEAKAELHFRIAQLYEADDSALEHFRRATELDPTHLGALQALRELYFEHARWPNAIATLQAEVKLHKDPKVQAELHCQLGALFAEKIGDEDQSVHCFASARRLDPGNEQATTWLAHYYFENEQWRQALPMLKRLVEKLECLDPAQGHRATVRLGQTALRLGDLDSAEQAYKQACRLNREDVSSLLALGDVQFRKKSLSDARLCYEKALSFRDSSFSRGQIVPTLCRMGMICRQLGEPKNACKYFDKATRRDPRNRGALESLAAIHAEMGRWRKVHGCKVRILELLEGDERVRMLHELAELCRRKLYDDRKAIVHLMDAASLAPGDRGILHSLLEICRDNRRWRDAVGVIQQIADVEERPEAKSRYLYTVGVILRDELSDERAALGYFEAALDADPRNKRACSAIESLLVRKRAFRPLERTYRKLIYRLSKEGEPDIQLQYAFWKKLGELYRDCFNDRAAAVKAFQAATALNPNRRSDHKVLAELYAASAEGLQQAAERYQWLIEREPRNPEAYHLLFDLYVRAGAEDRAWCVARTLVHLGAATAKEQAVYRDRRATRPRKLAEGGVSARDWAKYLYHPDVDKTLAAVLRCLAQPLQQSRYGGLKGSVAALEGARSLSRRSDLAVALQSAQRVLAPDWSPRLFSERSRPHGLRSVLCASPSTLAGATVLSGWETSELRFLAGHHMAYHRSEFYVRKMLPARTELGNALLVALCSVGAGVGHRTHEQDWEVLRARMTSGQVETLQKACKLFVQAGARTDLKRFVQTAELTACRAGFLMADDLGAAVRAVERLESAGPDDLVPSQKIAELVTFSVSEAYFKLRACTGVGPRNRGG